MDINRNTTNGTKTTITMTRDNAATGDQPELNPSATSMNVIWARGSDINVAYHGGENRMSATVSVSASTSASKSGEIFPNVWFMVMCLLTAFSVFV